MSWLISIGIFILVMGLIIGFCLLLDYFDLVELFLNFMVIFLLGGVAIILILLIHQLLIGGIK